METKYDLTEAAQWLEVYSPEDMAERLKTRAIELAGTGLENDDFDPKVRVLRMQEAVLFVCGFLETIKKKDGA